MIFFKTDFYLQVVYIRENVSVQQIVIDTTTVA